MKLKNALILLLTATIWGVAFVAQSVGMDYVSPFTFNGVRSIIGGLVLIPVILVLDRKKKAEGKDYKAPGDRKTLILGGICCGVALCVASNFQQFGVMYTSVGKVGFITACYIIIVPILSLFLGKKCSPAIAGAVVLAVAGLYLLCMSGSDHGLQKGDFLIMIVLLLYYRKNKKDGTPGNVGFLYMLLYGVGRFLVEFLRNDNRGGAWMFSTSQWISMVIVAGGIVLYLVNKKRHKW